MRGKGTAPKHMFLLMLDLMSIMQTFACSIHVKAKKPNSGASELAPSKTHQCWYVQHFGPSNATKMYRHKRTRSLLLLLIIKIIVIITTNNYY